MPDLRQPYEQYARQDPLVAGRRLYAVDYASGSVFYAAISASANSFISSFQVLADTGHQQHPKWAFATEAAARAFIKDHGGIMATWSEAVAAARGEIAPHK